MKKVLIITYYWPPSGGAGVQRWVKFVKYLSQKNIDITVYTPSNPDFEIKDKQLESEIPDNVKIIQSPIIEPFSIYRKFTKESASGVQNGSLSADNISWKKKLAIWIRGNFFIPDARFLWIKPSVKLLSKTISKNNFDTIITTGPPHSMHLIGLKLKRKFTGIKWIADFRDPWTNIDFYKDLKLSKLADKKHKKLERQVLKTADEVVTVGETLKNELIDLGAKKCSVITNGFDLDDIKSISFNEKSKDKFTISHIGTLGWSRNPQNLWKSLELIIKSNEEFSKKLEIKLIGNVDPRIFKEIEKFKLKKYLTYIPYINHTEAIIEQKKANLLLLLINNTPNAKGILTGKFFEYLSSKIPILCIGPKDGDIAEIIKETNSGIVKDYQEEIYLKDFDIKTSVSEREIYKYSRESLTEDLIKLL
jgi:glycosyltransferase involved in cell wall biosynthesis